MVGRPKIIRTAEEWKEIHRQRRKKYQSYHKMYQKHYYLKKLLADPDLNKKRWAKSKLKKDKEKSQNTE